MTPSKTLIGLVISLCAFSARAEDVELNSYSCGRNGTEGSKIREVCLASVEPDAKTLMVVLTKKNGEQVVLQSISKKVQGGGVEEYGDILTTHTAMEVLVTDSITPVSKKKVKFTVRTFWEYSEGSTLVTGTTLAGDVFETIIDNVQDDSEYSNKAPQCLLVGSKSEGWYRDGKRIGWDNCSIKSINCAKKGTASEGWYSSHLANFRVITAAQCSVSSSRQEKPKCVNIGTRSEGWALGDKFLGYDNCKNRVVRCKSEDSFSSAWVSLTEEKQLVLKEKCAE